MNYGEIELAAVTDVFRGVASRWRLSALEVTVLLGLDSEGGFWSEGMRLNAAAETRLRLLCELDRLLVGALGDMEIADWLRSEQVGGDPLTFLSLGLENIRAMVAAARCRVREDEEDQRHDVAKGA